MKSLQAQPPDTSIFPYIYAADIGKSHPQSNIHTGVEPCKSTRAANSPEGWNLLRRQTYKKSNFLLFPYKNGKLKHNVELKLIKRRELQYN